MVRGNGDGIIVESGVEMGSMIVIGSGIAPADGLLIAPLTTEGAVEEPLTVNLDAKVITGALGMGGGPEKPTVGEIDTSNVLCLTKDEETVPPEEVGTEHIEP